MRVCDFFCFFSASIIIIKMFYLLMELFFFLNERDTEKHEYKNHFNNLHFSQFIKYNCSHETSVFVFLVCNLPLFRNVRDFHFKKYFSIDDK